MLYKWNHTVYILFESIFSTQHNSLEIHPFILLSVFFFKNCEWVLNFLHVFSASIDLIM